MQLDQPSIIDNEVLDQWRIPFGDWYDQGVDWVANSGEQVLSVIEWPFDKLIALVNDQILLKLPWLVIVIAFFIIGTLLQNVRVGAFSAIALTICGLMGNAYWAETAKTIGFIFVAVLLCVIIGVPVGIAAGRVDAIWLAVRPILDAMQVVHSFVYMLPFIYFFGIGETSATMVTMVFALPPLIRLTNLGIRQVPEDVVEASRAFGQTELNILRDVQLPLARPAIMTGINQTLLLSISMLGIAALMGAGGLAKFMFQALNNQDPALSGSAGLSFFLVAVVLDRITQREGTTKQGTLSRLQAAWRNTKTPEKLLVDGESPVKKQSTPPVNYEPIGAVERTGILVAIGGSVVALVSVFLTWNSDGGWFSSWSRRIDELGSGVAIGRDGKPLLDAAGDQITTDYSGVGFNGLSGHGGSWFGYVIVFAALLVILAGVLVLRSPGRTSRWLNPDGALILSIASVVIMVAYVLSSPAPLSVASGGIGPFIGLAGALIMAVGSFIALRAAPHSPLTPLPFETKLGPIIIAGFAVATLLAAGYSGWTFDTRSDGVIGADIQAQMDELRAEAVDPDTPSKRVTAIANEIGVLKASANISQEIITDGFDAESSKIARGTLIAGILALATAVLSVGIGFKDTSQRWLAGAITMGLGAGVLGVAIGWIGTLARTTDQNVVSGVGVLLTLIAGATLVAAGRPTVNEFRRNRVYEDASAITVEVEVR